MAAIMRNENNTVTVSYPTKESQQDITKAEYALVVNLGSNGKIVAIKFIRSQYDLGLYEAKQIVETILARLY